MLKDNSEYVEKFDAIFLGYSLDIIAFNIYAIYQHKVMENTDVTFDENKYHGLEDNEIGNAP